MYKISNHWVSVSVPCTYQIVRTILTFLVSNPFSPGTHDLPYCLERACTKVNRLLGALENQLLRHGQHYICGSSYTIADVNAWPWIWALYNVYDDCITAKFEDLSKFPLVKKWYERCVVRPSSKRSLDVCSFEDMTTSAVHQKA